MGDFATDASKALPSIGPSSECAATRQAILDLRATLIALNERELRIIVKLNALATLAHLSTI